MTDAIDTAARGIATGVERLDRTADRIARDTDSTDVATNMVELLRAKNQDGANVRAVRTADAMIGTILDVLA